MEGFWGFRFQYCALGPCSLVLVMLHRTVLPGGTVEVKLKRAALNPKGPST